MTKIAEVIGELEKLAPPALQEDYDNSGLLTGNTQDEIKGILITLDVTEEVMEEAIRTNCNLIISHHPVIFRGLKKLTGSNFTERIVIAAVKNNIALYAIHTNLDNVRNGVNFKIAEKLGLKNVRILAPKKGGLKKLITFIPLADTLKVLKAIHETGAGNIGNYSECSFKIEGIGSFRPSEEAIPAIGQADKLENVKENRVEVIFPAYLENQVLRAMKSAHPYEEPAFDIFPLDNRNPEAGSGVIGELENMLSEEEFLKKLKKDMNLKLIRHTALSGNKVSRVALCGGSGSFLLKNAIQAQAQFFISADFKYHEFFEADSQIIIADIGHNESEIFTKELLYEFLMKKFSNIAVILSKINTNPISYLS